MKLTDIKRRMLDAYFTATGTGISEAELDNHVDELLSILKLDEQRYELLEDLNEHEDSTDAYRALMQEDVAFGYILDEGHALYMVARSGRKFASLNLTSPNKVTRYCTLREVRNAFLEAPEHSSSPLFKIKSLRVRMSA